MRLGTVVRTVLLTGAVSLGCQDESGGVTDMVPQFAKPGGGTKVDNSSRANVLWAESVTIDGVSTPAGIRGDGRDRFGQLVTGPGEYQGDHCGARANIYNEPRENGYLDLEFDAMWQSSMESACGQARKLAFYLSGADAAPVMSGPHSHGVDIWQLADGATRLQGMDFGVQLTNCRLSFNDAYPPASHVRLTRLTDVTRADGVIVRQWTIESRGSHTASCIVAGKGGKFQSTGVSYFLPFSILVTEVPYPYPTFP